MSKLSPGAQVRYTMLGEFVPRVMRIHNLVEQFASSQANTQELQGLLARAFNSLKIQFTGAGLDNLANLCGSMEIASRRGLGKHMKVRILREAVGSLRLHLEVEQRNLIAEAKAAEEREKKKQEEKQEQG